VIGRYGIQRNRVQGFQQGLPGFAEALVARE
jgi:hypothetical protein